MSVIHDAYGQGIGQYNPLNVTSIQKKWKDSFNSASLDTTKWNLVQTGSGMTVTQSGGTLAITSGVNANAETILETVATFSGTFRAIFGFMMSQKIANCALYLEVISVDPTTYVTNANDGFAWVHDGNVSTTTTNASYETWNGGRTHLLSGSMYTGISDTGWGMNELELFADEAWFHARGMDSASQRATSYVRHQQIPDPNAWYRVRIRLKNGSTAPVSSTTATFQYVTIIDYSELTTEITAGRGASASGQGLAVNVANTPSVYLQSNSSVNYDTSTLLGASATFTGSARDTGSTTQYNRFRVVVAHLAGLVPGTIVIEQSSDNVTFRETHRVPIPSDGTGGTVGLRTFDYPILMRYIRVKFINGATAQTAFWLSTNLIRVDGAFDFDKTLQFVHSTTAVGASATVYSSTLDLGAQHSFIRHRVMEYSDQTGLLFLEESRDGVAWRRVASVNDSIGVPQYLEAPITMRYVRCGYTNNATANTSFELTSALIKN